MTAPATTRSQSTLSLYLTHSHAQLGDMLASLLTAMGVDDRSEVWMLWNELESALIAHMEAEERFALPMFAHVDRDAALELLREHGLIREEMFELGIAVDLHCIRYNRARDFASLLERHAAREEKLLYRWAHASADSGLVSLIESHATPPA